MTLPSALEPVVERVWEAMQALADDSGRLEGRAVAVARRARVSPTQVMFSAGWLVQEGRIELVGGGPDDWRLLPRKDGGR